MTTAGLPKVMRVWHGSVSLLTLVFVCLCSGCTKQDEKANEVPPVAPNAKVEQPNMGKVNSLPKQAPVDGVK